MRAPVLALLALSLSQTALAADLDVPLLRGTQYGEPAAAQLAAWDGPYFGGFGGVSQSHFHFNGAFNTLVGGLSNVRDTVLEQEYGISKLLTAVQGSNVRGPAYGGFVGYNVQFEDVVLGFEVDYTRAKLSGSRSDSIGRTATTANGYVNDFILTGTAKTELSDYGTLRVRAGYTSGAFMPFVTAGLAVGSLDTSTTATARIGGYNQTAYGAWVANPQTIPVGSIDHYGYGSFDPYDLAGRRVGTGVTGTVSKSTVAVGFTAGAGVDVALSQNIFLRGEYQFAWFDDFSGHKFNVNTIRGGAGIKF